MPVGLAGEPRTAPRVNGPHIGLLEHPAPQAHHGEILADLIVLDTAPRAHLQHPDVERAGTPRQLAADVDPLRGPPGIASDLA